MGMLEDDMESGQARTNATRLRNGRENIGGALPADAPWTTKRANEAINAEHPAIVRQGQGAPLRDPAQQMRDAILAAGHMARTKDTAYHATAANALDSLAAAAPDDVLNYLRRLIRN